MRISLIKSQDIPITKTPIDIKDALDLQINVGEHTFRIDLTKENELEIRVSSKLAVWPIGKNKVVLTEEKFR